MGEGDCPSRRDGGGRCGGWVGGGAAFGAAGGGGSEVVAAGFAAAMHLAATKVAVFLPEIPAEEDGEGEEDGGEGEGYFQVPEHALVAPAAAELDAQELELLEVLAPVFAFLAAEDQAVGVGDDPIARFGGADVEVVGDLEGACG